MEEEENSEHATDTANELVEPAQLENAAFPEPDAATAPAALTEPDESAMPSFVYALGEIDFRFPTSGLEKEVMQVAGTLDRPAVEAAISDKRNRYLARGLCWILSIGGLEAYILVPRDPADYERLTEAIADYAEDESDYAEADDSRTRRSKKEKEEQRKRFEPGRRPAHVDLVIGTLGPIAPPELCNGLSIPMVFFDQIYSFPRASLIQEIPIPPSVTDDAGFRETAGRFFDHVMQMTDNAGATEEHRALNYLAVRYPRIYVTLVQEDDQDTSLAGIAARPSPVSEVRRIVDVIFSFRHRQTDVITKYLARVDVNDLYPFLVMPLSPYYDLP